LLAQKLILSYSSKIFVQFIRIAASIVVARIAGPTVLGTVAFGLAFVSILSFLGDLGTGTAHIKLVSEGQDLSKCVATFSVIKIILTCFYSLIVLSVFLFQKYIFNVKFESTTHEYVIFIMLGAAIIDQLLLIPKTTFTARTEQAKKDIPDFTRTIIYQILRVIVVLLGYKAIALALGNLISAILIAPFIFYLFRNYPKGKFNKELAIKYFKISLPILVIGMSTKIGLYIDKVSLQYFTNSTQVGFYSAGYRIGSFVLMIANSVGLLFFPYFSKAAYDKDFKYIKNTIDKFERFSFIFIMPGIIFLSLYSDVIIRVVLGTQYLPSIPIMAVINLAMFLMVLNMPYGDVIMGMGFFKLAAIINLINLIVFSCLILILPNPKLLNLGSLGVAISVLLSNLLIGILYRIYSVKKCKILNPKKNIKFVIFGIVNYFGFYLIYNHFGRIHGTNFKMFFIPLYFGITYSILFLLRWINSDDFYYIKELANLRKLGKYIKSEVKEK